MELKDNPPATGLGEVRSPVGPLSPICPWLLLPQQYAALATVTAHVWYRPAPKALNWNPPIGDIGNARSVFVPSPSCALAL
jgi:hypothetical protein